MGSAPGDHARQRQHSGALTESESQLHETVLALLVVVVAPRRRRLLLLLARGDDAQADRRDAAVAADAGGRGGQGRRWRRWQPRRWRRFGGGGFGGGGLRRRRWRRPRPAQMTVEVGAVKRADMSEEVMVVGNLIGAGNRRCGRARRRPARQRSPSASAIRSGAVSRWRRSKTARSSSRSSRRRRPIEVSAATIRQREADLRLAQIEPRPEQEPVRAAADSEADVRRHRRALSGGAWRSSICRRRSTPQAAARLDELKLVARQHASIHVAGQRLRLQAHARSRRLGDDQHVVHVVRRHLDRASRREHRRKGSAPRREGPGRRRRRVDAFPGETFKGRIARISPVLDPATRTAQIEVEIDNPQVRLKPGMYAKVDLTVEHHPSTLVVPTNARGGSPGASVACSSRTRARTASCRASSIPFRLG